MMLVYLGVALLLSGGAAAGGTQRSGLERAPRAFAKVSLKVKDADLRDVLGVLASEGGLDLVVGEGVQGRVTLSLRNARWPDAMASVLQAHGLGFELDGSVLWVDTLGALAQSAQLRAARREAKMELEPLATRIIPVSHARASELAALVRSFLSPRGSVTVDVRTNSLIVTDVAERVARVETLVGSTP